MKRLFSFILAVGGIILLAAPANALDLISEDFSPPATVTVGGIDTTSDYDQWLDFPSSDPTLNRWDIENTMSNYYAQHVFQGSDNTNILMFGVDASSLSAGASLYLSFDWLSDTSRARAYIVAMDIDVHYLDPFGPWLDGETNPLASWEVQRPGTDGVVLERYDIGTGAIASSAGDLSDPSTWNHFLSPLAVPWLAGDYDTLAVAFVMGGTDGVRVVDNVNLYSSVPEPATMLLLGTGLICLAGFRRKLKN